MAGFDPLEIGWQSLKNIYGAMKNAKGKGIVDEATNKLTHGLVALSGELLFRLPFKLVAEPGAKLTGAAVAKMAQYAIDWTKVGLLSLPIIPGPARAALLKKKEDEIV